MKIEINITKTHLYLFFGIILLFTAAFVIGQNPGIGHSYAELDLTNSIRSSDIKDREITANDIKFSGGFAELSVYKAKTADNADAARCEFRIIRCNGNSPGYGCRNGFSEMPGSFSINGEAIDYMFDGGSNGRCIDTNGDSWIGLCCKYS